MIRRLSLLGLILLALPWAAAQSPALGVTFDRWFGTGAPTGLGVSANLPLWAIPGGDWGALGVRVDSVLTLEAPARPSVGASALWSRPAGGFDLFIGSGVDLSWREVLGIPCYTLGWSILGGVNVPVGGDVSMRLEGRWLPQAARGGVMVGLSLPLD